MREIYTKRVTRLPDELPSRIEKGIEVDYTSEGKVADIYIVDETGRKSIDLDGNVKESYSKTVTANGSVTIDNVEYGEEYTSVKEVAVNVTVTPVELTQAEYDALVDAGTVDPNTIYLISNEEAVL